MTATMNERYLVVADEDHKDVVVGAYTSVADARHAVDVYNRSVVDPFCWIEVSPQTTN